MPIHAAFSVGLPRGRNAIVSSIAVFGILCVTIIGCGSGELTYPPPVAVSGKVALQGQPLTGGTIHFSPVDPKKTLPGSGQIQSDGSFKVTTKKPDDGLVPGQYNVFFDPAVSADSSTKGAASTFPGKYLAPTTSQISQTIDKPTSTIQIILQ